MFKVGDRVRALDKPRSEARGVKPVPRVMGCVGVITDIHDAYCEGEGYYCVDFDNGNFDHISGVYLERVATPPPAAPPPAAPPPPAALTLRDQFAMAALTGLLADPDTADAETYGNETYEETRDSMCKAAYDYADAMLAARSKGGAK